MNGWFEERGSITWSPLDESEESYLIGALLFGKHQHEIRRQARERAAQPVGEGEFVVTSVCQETKTVTLRVGKL